VESPAPPDAWQRHQPIGLAAEADGDDRVASLVRAAQGGDLEAFGVLFDRFHLPVYRYIAARIEGQADAEDLAAETFATALRAIGRFRWRGAPFEAWLFRIARSKIIDHQRRTKRRPASELTGSEPATQPYLDPEVHVVRDEERTQLLSAIRRLSADQLEVVALRFFADLSVTDIARVMDRSPGAVRQLQLRALTTLRQKMEWLR
jgi:RNA polymerase sigma-70 factor (ECF subfamily)